MSDAERRLRGFARSLLRAFDAADKYAADRLGVRGTEAAISASGLSRGASTATAESRAMLERLHAVCVREPITELCTLLGVPQNAENPVQRALCTDKRDKASSHNGKQQAMCIAQQISITPQDLQAVMQAITDAFLEVENSLSRTRSKRGWVSDYKPDWRTRFLVWELVKSFGRITAPEEISFDFKRLKQAVFAAMFNGNYLNEQRKRARFRDTVLRHIPMPAQLDANITWLAVAVFISVPIASVAHSYRDGNNIRAFWGTLLPIFFGTGLGTLLFYSFYQSNYASKLLDKAAAAVPNAARLSFGYENVTEIDDDSDSQHRLGHVPGSSTSKQRDISISMDSVSMSREQVVTAYVGESLSKPSEVAVLPPESANIDVKSARIVDRPTSKASLDEVQSARTKRVIYATDASTRKHPANIEDEVPSAMLNLYKVTMLVERLFSSSHFDDQWAVGLSELRLYEAMELILQSDGTFGSQFASFSFAAISLSSRGAAVAASTVNAGARFSFSVFAVLAACGFLCGLTGQLLADRMLRLIALTQTKEEGTAHEFAVQFGVYFRIIGGLIGFAGMFLSTAVFHFLFSIFQVSLAVALPMAVVWMIASSVVLESFLASFSYWSLNEVFEDLGEIVERPELNSPSPVTGTIQRMSRWFKSRVLRIHREKRN